MRRRELLDQRLATSGRIGRDQHAARIGGDEALEFRREFLAFAVQREARRRLCAEIDGRFARARGDDVDAKLIVEAFAQLLRRQVQLAWRQDRALDIVGALLVAFRGMGPEGLGRVEYALSEHEQGVRREVVEQGLGQVEEQWQVVLDSGRGRTFLDVLVERTMARVDREALAQGVAERLDRRLGERKFARGQQTHRIDDMVGALRIGVEAADRLDLVVEQFDAVRLAAAHREDVEQGAAHRKLAGLLNLWHVAVARGLETALLAGDVEFLSQREHESGTGDVAARSESLHQRRDRHDEHAALQPRQAVQCGDALRDDVRMRREQVVGQGFPVRELQDLEPGSCEHRELRLQCMGRMGVVGDRNDDARMHAAGFGERERETGAVRCRPVAALFRGGWKSGAQQARGHDRGNNDSAAASECAARRRASVPAHAEPG